MGLLLEKLSSLKNHLPATQEHSSFNGTLIFISVHNNCIWSLFSSYPIYLQYILILVSIHTCILQVVYLFQIF